MACPTKEASPEISYHKPFIRSALAKSLYERMMREEQLRKFDKDKWYTINHKAINDADIQDKFVASSCDEGTEAFLSNCYEKSDWFFTHVFHSVARTILTLFMTSTSINGFLGRGSMFVFSSDQFKQLYDGVEALAQSGSESRLLDLGAGDGKVTEIMAQYFRETHVTEISPVMKRLLAKKNYKVLEVENWFEGPEKYDVISCLNLLDRCDKPVTIISQMKAKLKPNGRILLALVLPFSQYVENTGSNSSCHRPTEVVDIDGQTFEEQIVSLNAKLLLPNGLEIVKWTRLPYLCEGDLDLSFYWLNDFVCLLKNIDEEV